MPWTLVTAPDERERCCVSEGGERCERPAARRVSGSPAWDDYTYVCLGHVELVTQDQTASVVEPIADFGAPQLVR